MLTYLCRKQAHAPANFIDQCHEMATIIQIRNERRAHGMAVLLPLSRSGRL
ncbi:hypothetical protein SXCC_03464 [Gluconacetobacter sp. SXCC-1]|nr:hypothetical protein SXCC_03464 [Gluconacetobacter sp. SXCC-1]